MFALSSNSIMTQEKSPKKVTNISEFNPDSPLTRRYQQLPSNFPITLVKLNDLNPSSEAPTPAPQSPQRKKQGLVTKELHQTQYSFQSVDAGPAHKWQPKDNCSFVRSQMIKKKQTTIKGQKTGFGVTNQFKAVVMAEKDRKVQCKAKIDNLKKSLVNKTTVIPEETDERDESGLSMINKVLVST